MTTRTSPGATPGPEPTIPSDDLVAAPPVDPATALPVGLAATLPADFVVDLPVDLTADFLTARSTSRAGLRPVTGATRAVTDPTRLVTGPDLPVTDPTRRVTDPPPVPNGRPLAPRRPWAVTALAGTLVTAAGLAVTTWGSGAAAHALGDALYAVLVLVLVRFAAPRRPLAVQGMVAFVICALVELAQLSGVPAAVVAVVPPARYLVGTTFAAPDLLSYGVGVLAAVLMVVVLRHVRRVVAPVAPRLVA